MSAIPAESSKATLDSRAPDLKMASFPQRPGADDFVDFSALDKKAEIEHVLRLKADYRTLLRLIVRNPHTLRLLAEMREGLEGYTHTGAEIGLRFEKRDLACKQLAATAPVLIALENATQNYRKRPQSKAARTEYVRSYRGALRGLRALRLGTEAVNFLAPRLLTLPESALSLWDGARQKSFHDAATPLWRSVLSRTNSILEAVDGYLEARVKTRFSDKGMRGMVDDLTQEARSSTCRAIHNFVDKNTRFRTYAAFWWDQSIYVYLSQKSHTVRHPTYIVKGLKKARQYAAQFSEEHGRPPSEEELRRVFKPAVVALMTLKTLSLNAQFGEEQSSLSDSIADTRSADPVKQVPDDEFRRFALGHLGRVLRELSVRERIILASRMGLGGRRIKTLAELADIFGVTPERIRQLQNRSAEQIRKRLSRVLPSRSWQALLQED